MALFLAWASGAEAAPPSVGPAWTSEVSESSARLNAELAPGGLGTSYRFEYVSEAGYRADVADGGDGFGAASKVPVGADPVLAGGGGAATVSAVVGTLASGTPALGAGASYLFRLRATNGDGGASGAALPFATLPLGSNSFMLDSRGWELVSPADKGGGDVQAAGQVFGGGLVQAARHGSALSFSSSFAFGGAAADPPGSQYVSRRGQGSWGTENVNVAVPAGAYGEDPDGVPYQLFSGDLGRALVFDGTSCAGGPCLRRYSLREEGGASMLSPAAGDLRFAGAAEDLSAVVLSSCEALTGDATEVPGLGGCDPGEPNLYIWSAAGLELVNLLPGDAVGTPGASLAAPAGAVGGGGARVYFTQGGDLYLRNGSLTQQVDAGVGGGGTFEAASTSGAVAFFTKAGSLYRWNAGTGTATDLTPDGGVQGVLGVSAAGDRAYFQDAGGLRLWLDGALVTVAAGAAAAAPSNFPPGLGTARVTADGSKLAFVSAAPLTPYDNRGAPGVALPGEAGLPQRQVYLYDAGADSLTCASCNPTGERPLGPSTIPAAVANGTSPLAPRPYRPRALSEDGWRLFFDSYDDLALRDRSTSARRPDPDVYEWEAQGVGSCQREGGCLAIVSGGRSASGSTFLDASANGGDAFFLTSDSLVGADSGAADVYDAREGGGFPDPERPIACVGDACQFLPSEPWDPQPGTLVPSPGNPPLRIDSTGAPRKKRCAKGKVKRKGRCVRKHRKPATKRRGARR